MEKKSTKYLNSANSGKLINKDLKNICYRFNLKRSKIKPRNIFNNNKLFAFQKAAGNFTLLKKLIHQTFVDKYYHDKNFYNVKVIGNIINNESTHVVAQFKDYLIYGDDSEFLQKIYNMEDIKKYLPKIFDYYECCSVIFPNYVILYESKYIYKNIQKKQRVIDKQQEQEEKIERIKNGLINEKEVEEGKNDYSLFNTKAIYSILGQTNTSNINKIFGLNNDINKGEKNENEIDNSDLLFKNIINELDKIEEKKNCMKQKINLIKNKCKIPSLALNDNKGLTKRNNNNITNENINKDKNNIENYKYYKKKNYIIINKQNNNKYSNNEEYSKNLNNTKHFHIKIKSLSKRSEEDKSSINLNNSKKIKNQKSMMEKNNFLTNEKTTNNIYSKIPKSKLSIDLDGIKKHHKIKSILNDQEIQKDMSFFKDILKLRKNRRKNTKINTSMGKSSYRIKKIANSFIPSQKQFFKIMKKKNNYQNKSIKKNKEIITKKNYSSSPSFVKNKIIVNNSKPKAPIIHIKDSNSTINIIKNNTYINNNNLTSSQSRSIIRKKMEKKGNKFNQEYNNNEKLITNREIISESNINININTLPITEKERNNKKIFFTIAPHINNKINLNKIKYMIRNISKDNIINSYHRDVKNISKNSKNKINKKNNIVNKKYIYYNKNMNKIKKKSNSFKSSNTQISSSLITAACSMGKNSHLKDFDTIKVIQKRKYPYSIGVKSKTINEKCKINNNISNKKFSLSPDKIGSLNIIKKILLRNPISNNDTCNKCINNKKIHIYDQNKKQKNIVLPIRKEKDPIEIKIKDMINLILNNKGMSFNYGNSRNKKNKHPNTERSIVTYSNKTNNSISTNGSNRKSFISMRTFKNSNSNNKNKIIKHIFDN